MLFKNRSFVVSLTNKSTEEEIIHLITSNGGKVKGDPNEAILIVDVNKRDGKSVDYQYITTCLKRKEVLVFFNNHINQIYSIVSLG